MSCNRDFKFPTFRGLSLVFQFEDNGVSAENIECLAGHPDCAHMRTQRVAHRTREIPHVLNLRLLMSYIYIYIYGAPSNARNANVVYIWTYVWQR